MAQTVMIKSNKYGINLILDPDIAFADLLKAVIEKFKESEKFFKNSKLGISFEGRKLSDEEEQKIIDAITENTTIEILCVVDNSEEGAQKMKAQIDAYSEAIEREYAKAKVLVNQGLFYFCGAFRYLRCLYLVPRKPQNAEKHYSPSRCSAFLSLKDWYSLKSHNDIYSTAHSRVPLKLPVECADRI